ncbi:methyltransferase-like protein 25 [Arapaima gigas]
MSSLATLEKSIDTIKRAIDGIKDFLSVSLRIANAHTVDFYSRDVWQELVAVSPDSVLAVLGSTSEDRGTATVGRPGCTYGFCDDTKRLVDVEELLTAAKLHSLPALDVCVPVPELLQALRGHSQADPLQRGVTLEPAEFMNSKKSHEVQILSEMVAALARCCCVQQVIDVGSGKGYLCSFLSMQYSLKVYGIDSSSTNTHGAQERNRKLKKYSRAYQRRGQMRVQGGAQEGSERSLSQLEGGDDSYPEPLRRTETVSGDEESMQSFLSLLPLGAVEMPSRRVPPGELPREERERRKQENLQRKGQGARDDGLYSPLTSYVTAETELKEIITELEDAVLVGLHTCGDLAPSTLRMFVAKPELQALCSVSCCYHLLSEEFDSTAQGKNTLTAISPALAVAEWRNTAAYC